MQIKIFLIGILIGCSYLIGEEVSKRYVKRHRQLNDLIRVLEIMRMELSFGMYTLEELFRNIASMKEYCFGSFFEDMAEDLSKQEGSTIEYIFDKNKEVLYRETYLRDREVEELKKLLSSLGKSEIGSQERLIDLTVENLKKLTLDSKEDINKKGNLYKKLITFSAICLSIILI